MSSSYRVRLLPEAKQALTETTRYIVERDGPERAAGCLRRLLDDILAVGSAPGVHPVVQVRNGRAIRSKLAAKVFRVFYVVVESECVVFVIDVVHGARDSRLARYRDA